MNLEIYRIYFFVMVGFEFRILRVLDKYIIICFFVLCNSFLEALINNRVIEKIW